MWSAVRTTYLEPDLTGLIAACMRPLAMTLRERFAPDCTLLWSHWKRGLHVNLVCKIDSSQRASFQECCLSWISAWLERNPSTFTLDHGAYIASSRQLGGLEGDSGPFGPLRPNNHAEVWTYLTRDVAGSRTLGVLWERFLDHSLEAIFELAALRRTDAEGFYAKLTAMFATIGAFGGPRGLAHGHLSFRAHAEGLLATSPKARPVFERADRALGPLVARELAASLSPNCVAPPWLAMWRLALRELNEEIDRVVEADGALELEMAAGPPILAASQLGAAMQRPAARALFSSAAHKQYRILVNFFYRILPTIGLAPLERARFAYVFAARCQDILDVDWQSVFYQDQG